MNYIIVDQNVVDSSWNGVGRTLEVNDSVSMPQTPAGTMIFGYFNLATQNNLGSLFVSSGGDPPMPLTAPANANQLSLLTRNWGANNLNVSNTSAHANTPIWISAYGPGTPGQLIVPLPTDGTSVPLVTTQSAQGMANPQYMQLVMQSNTPTLCIFGIIGGPQDDTGNNGYVVQVNAQQNSGPDGPTPPIGYYATTTSNAYTFQFNWGSSLVYVVNMSPVTASGAHVLLRNL
jgi:hypothetical protein